MNIKTWTSPALVVAVAAGILVGQPGAARADNILETVNIIAADNDIFNAGHPTPPLGDGAPLKVDLPANSAGSTIRVAASGGVTQGVNEASTSPDGGYDPDLAMNIDSFDGISGIIADAGLGGFLAGVFTSDAEPAGQGPERLDYAAADPGHLTTTQTEYHPAIDQLFFIGDGFTGTGTGTSQQFVVPAGATALWLGVSDAGFYQGQPIPTTGNTGGFTATVSLAAPLTTLDAGTFVNFRHNPGLGEACTTGFGVSKNGADYELAAKHCFDTTDFNQLDNSHIAQFAPVRVSTSDDAFYFADSLNCSPPKPASCVLPTVVRGETGDMMAWKPDAVPVSGKVQTSAGLLPVVGQKSPSQVAGTKVCHYGAGSFGQGAAERCDMAAPSLAKTVRICLQQGLSFCNGIYPIAAFGIGGDSGGPVYQYDIVKGQAVGVYAVGITVIAGSALSFYVPMKTIEQRMGVKLITRPPLSSSPGR